MDDTKGKIKLSIYAIAILMMGVVGISSSLSVISQHFPDISQTMIQNLISIPCIVIIPVTIIVGKLMQIFSKKGLAVWGAILFLIGGVLPAFTLNFTFILFLRGVFGIGIGIIQVVSTALVAEHFEGEERNKVQGNLQAFQMLGCAIMVFMGGFLASMHWNFVFYVHFLAVPTILAAVMFLPNNKPAAENTSEGENHKVTLTKSLWIWMIVCFFVFCTGQIYSISFSYVITEKAVGESAAAGLGMAFFCIGGILMGMFYGKLAKITGNFSMGIGFFVVAAAYILIATAPSIIVCYIGSLVFGLGMSIVMPGIFLSVAGSVDMYSAGMAISVATCVQNFGQFCCPYLVNPVASGLGNGSNNNIIAFYIAATMASVLGIAMIIYAVSVNSKKRVTV